MLRFSFAASVALAASGALMMGAASGGFSCEVSEQTVADGRLDQNEPRQETITGRLVNIVPEQPGVAGWSLQRPQRLVALDVSNVLQRAQRLRGERVRLEGHYVNLGLGRTFIVTRIRRA